VIAVTLLAMSVWKRYNALYIFYCFYTDVMRLEEKITNQKWQKRVRTDDIMLFNTLELMCQYAHYKIIKAEWIKDTFGTTIKRVVEEILNPSYPEKMHDTDSYVHLKKIYQSLYEKESNSGQVH
jgi:hypothetical protein